LCSSSIAATGTSGRPLANTRDTERLIEKHFLPKLRHRDIADIATLDLAQLINELLPTPDPGSPLEGAPTPVEIVPREVPTDGKLREVLSKAMADGSTSAKIVQLLITRDSVGRRLRPYVAKTFKTASQPVSRGFGCLRTSRRCCCLTRPQKVR